jgi:hypothetical protein
VLRSHVFFVTATERAASSHNPRKDGSDGRVAFLWYRLVNVNVRIETSRELGRFYNRHGEKAGNRTHERCHKIGTSRDDRWDIDEWWCVSKCHRHMRRIRNNHSRSTDGVDAQVARTPQTQSTTSLF